MVFSKYLAELWKVHPYREGNTRTIITFVYWNRWKHRESDVEEVKVYLLIHCYAGQSRSRAVGAFAVKMLGGR